LASNPVPSQCYTVASASGRHQDAHALTVTKGSNMTENMHSASSDHQRGGPPEPKWTSHLADLGHFRQTLMWRFAPEDPDQYCKVDRINVIQLQGTGPGLGSADSRIPGSDSVVVEGDEDVAEDRRILS
jgi:hypothetical protein